MAMLLSRELVVALAPAVTMDVKFLVVVTVFGS